MIKSSKMDYSSPNYQLCTCAIKASEIFLENHRKIPYFRLLYVTDIFLFVFNECNPTTIP